MAELERLTSRKPKTNKGNKGSLTRLIAQQAIGVRPQRLNLKAPGLMTDRLNESSVDSPTKPLAPQYKPTIGYSPAKLNLTAAQLRKRQAPFTAHDEQASLVRLPFLSKN